MAGNIGAQNYSSDILGGASNALGIAGGIEQGGAKGDIRAGTEAVGLANRIGFGSEALGTAASDVTAGLGLVTGLQEGGFRGDLTAGASAAKLGANFGLLPTSIGTLASGIMAPLALYNFFKNYQSGATGSDVLLGAAAGGAIGGPIGLGIGAAVGGIASIFGPGRQDPETLGWDGYAAAYQKSGAGGVAGGSPSQNFQMLAGIFDARGSNIPFYQRYGRMGENRFLGDMTSQIDQAIKAGRVPQDATAQQLYQGVVEPWINSMGGAQGWQNTNTSKGAPEKAAIGQLLTNLIGQYQTGELNSNEPLGIAGQRVNMPAYAGQEPGSQAQVARNKTPTGVSSAPGANMAPQYRMNDPSVALGGAAAGLGYQQTPTGVPPMTGTGGYTSPDGTASPATSPISDLTSFAPYALGTGFGIFGAKEAQASNQSAINPVAGAGQQLFGASTELLNRGMTGQLTPAQQQVVSTGQQQGQTLINAATPVGQIASGLFQQYNSGQLKPGDQAQLDQQVASAKAQMLQQLGPNVDSTTAQTYLDQIDQQAQITKQTMLDNYLSTGDQQFNTWSTTTQAGQKAILSAQQDAVSYTEQAFQDAFQAAGLGTETMIAAMGATLQSNSQVAQAFGNMMNNLMKGFALSRYAQSGGAFGAGSTDPYSSQNIEAGIPASTVNQDAAQAGSSALSDVNAQFSSQFNQPQFPSGSVEVGQPFDSVDPGSSFAFEVPSY